MILKESHQSPVEETSSSQWVKHFAETANNLSCLWQSPKSTCRKRKGNTRENTFLRGRSTFQRDKKKKDVTVRAVVGHLAALYEKSILHFVVKDAQLAERRTPIDPLVAFMFLRD